MPENIILNSKGVPCGDNQAFKVQLPYWSKIKFRASRTSATRDDGSTVFVYNIAVGTKPLAFSYGRGQPKVSGGFTTADGNAVNSDTNIAKNGETINGESVEIKSLSALPLPAGTDGDPTATNGPDLRLQDDHLVAMLSSCVSVQFIFNARAILDYGFPLMMPGSGGLSGRAPNLSNQSGLAGAPNDAGFVSNGAPAMGNSFGLPDSLWWNDDGNDSLISIGFNVDRPVVIWSGGDVDNKQPNVEGNNTPAVATGTQGYVYPSILMSEWSVHLHGTVWGARSRNI